MVKLFVGGFPLDMTEMELAMLFSPHGEVVTIKIVRDHKTGQCKGYAFIEMATEADAWQVIGVLDGTPVQERELTINITEENPTAAPKRTFTPLRQKGRFTKTPQSSAEAKKKRPRKQY